MKDDEDLPMDVADPTDPNAGDADAASIDKAEADRRTSVSNFRVGAWYRERYGSGSSDKGKANMFKELLHGRLDAGEGKPIKGQAWQFYSKHYYTERVKGRSDFDLLWARALARAREEGKVPADVKLRGEVTREVWGMETVEFRAQVVAQMDKEHQQAVRAWEIGRAEEPSRSKEELSAAPNNAGFYLQPLADSIQERFGMSVCIMLCGPVGDRGGSVEVRSVHAGRTRGLNPRKWYEYDRVGYRKAEKSMIRFAEKCYTPDECKGRAVGAASTSGTVLTSGTASTSGAVGSATQTGALGGGAPTAGSANPAPPPPASFEPAPPNTNPPQPPPPSFEHAPNTNPPPPSAAAVEPAPLNTNPPPTAAGVLRARAAQYQSSPTATAFLRAPGQDDRGVTPFDDEEAREPVAPAWRHGDMAKWPAELRKAYSGFALGTKWGEDWAELVNSYLDFEAVCGYQESGPMIQGAGKPAEIASWLKGGRKWFSPPHIARVGRIGEEGSYADNWWLWWRSIQPCKRLWVGGMLTSPVDMTWGKMPGLYGRNRFMQVVASLLWWGLQEFRSGENGEKSGWSLAVSDVECMLREMLRANVARVPTKKRKRGDDEDGAREDGGGKEPRAKRGEPSAVKPTRLREAAVKPRPTPKPTYKGKGRK
ncbi:hypothetical protein C8R47DRAFT_1212805 [Mycena vitilis]|nr:hypothetical protein C8R47DRAFT_1212805 [Mycena vitilis]